MARFVILLILTTILRSTFAANQVTLTCDGQLEGVAIGPNGTRGEKGEKGEPGQSDAWRSEFEILQARISVLEKAGSLCRCQATSCQDLLNRGKTQSGFYEILVNRTTIPVYCDQATDGGGWLTIQRRTDGSEDFFRNWTDYRRGFGNISNEFWLGLDVIHAITNSSSHELRVDLEDFQNETAYAKYSTFRVGSLADNFRLEVGGYNGTAGDALDFHNGQQFSTKDQDNDSDDILHCGVEYSGSFWYRNCHFTNLNGKYLLGLSHAQGITWRPWRDDLSLKRVEIKIRAV